MELRQNDILIRHATIKDAEILCNWWNDGKIMAHAGFPNGLNTNVEEIREQISENSDESMRLFIIEINQKLVGEMYYRNKGNNIAEIGIKICDFTEQEKGYGTKILKMFIGYLFNNLGYIKVILDTNLKNTRAQYVYEKIGFKKIRINQNSWKDQLGELQSSIDYELYKIE